MGKWNRRQEDLDLYYMERDVRNETKEDVKKLVIAWNEQGWPRDFESQMRAIIKNAKATQSIASSQSTVISNVLNAFLNLYEEDRIEAQRKTEQQAQAALQERPVVEKGLYRQPCTPGELVDDGERILVCLSCEFVKSANDYGQADDGYYCTFAEPSEQEKQSDAYTHMMQRKADDAQRKAEQQRRMDTKRHKQIEQWNREGVEHDVLDDFFAGTSDY